MHHHPYPLANNPLESGEKCTGSAFGGFSCPPDSGPWRQTAEGRIHLSAVGADRPEAGGRSAVMGFPKAADHKSLCNGTPVSVTLASTGSWVSQSRAEPFFQPLEQRRFTARDVFRSAAVIHRQPNVADWGCSRQSYLSDVQARL